MDDFFKFLIWAVIIISFFSSFFKKNKGKNTLFPQQRRLNNPDRERIGNYPQTTTTAGSDQNDIFREIEKLFKPENTPPEVPVPQQERTTTKSQTAIEKSEYESALKKQYTPEKFDKEWHEESASWHEETASKHVLETDWNKEKRKLAEERKKVNSKIEEEAKSFEKFLNQEEKLDSIILKTTKERLKHPQSLKEFIVISEILGKPKALRR